MGTLIDTLVGTQSGMIFLEGKLAINISVLEVHASPWDFPGGTVVKNPPANAGHTGSSSGLGGSHMWRSN